MSGTGPRPPQICKSMAILMRDDPEMLDEYDFSNSVRGKFHKEGAIHIAPIRLDTDVLAYFAKRARAKGTTLNELLNEILKKDMELIEAA